MPRRLRLDAIDRRILKELQTNGRMSNVDLAEKVGITPPPCLRRVRALEEAGFIEGYSAQIDAKRLGFEVTAFANVKLFSQSDVDLRAFENRAAGWSIVREVYMISGDVDYILKLAAPNLSVFNEFISRTLVSAPNVANVRSYLSMKRAKFEQGVAIPLGDDADER